MKDIYIKRNKLREASANLRSAKFDCTIGNKLSFKLDEEQDKVYQKFQFYNHYIKAMIKEKEGKNELRTKER